MAWVYILQTKNNQFYVGSTTDLKRRIKQHTFGQTRTTKRLHIKALVLRQKYSTLEDARSVERKIKKLKRHDYIECMIRDGYIRIRP